MRYAVINTETNKVVNVVVWEGAEWLPRPNQIVVESATAGIDDDWNPENETIVPIDRTATDPEPEEEV